MLVIVGGSMAAVKAPSVLRRLRERGARVQVIATRAALAFITELSLATAADGEVATDTTWFEARPDAQHLTLARAEAVVIVGASADLLARAAQGRADDLASATLLSVEGPVLWVPAMNERMWRHPAVQANVERLRGWGQTFLGPEVGSFGTRGEGAGLGRMAEPEDIAAATLALLHPPHSRDLAGVKVVVSAGPTREYLDPVRFISNPSSGKMGFAVAEEARDRGADVTLVTGPVNLPDPPGVDVVRIETALELRDAVLAAARDAQMVVMTAAVADYRAAERSDEKQAKVAGDVTIHLTPNPDILAELGRQKGDRVLVGFAMETHAGVERAALKAQRKNADFILLNYPTREGTAFGGDDNEVTLVRPDGTSEAWPRLSKREVARRLLDEAARVRQKAES
ncbi:bifunctional phosphopantothenoylcysteine decarboxylase/phosphopantothenate--cysteine ligase CoaBC [Deinococcus metallilatus]|uniref:Coenzyme A biosynthesis bifunctional protein CoaBC n=1 Tax=Deinococcus metallilatus TaxID=1211322 RepID=A0AAJ5F0V5_9DEIO|nr:bifunctional phosphopantothenoylcysteine decarboxylase/phosphopantothenate--cysteine ligase CoaBC [Deinococcus metallilatus]RXJ08345.1 bifunctional phosphopantothenoylcysteine decarboxylase/phosphopantothenate--cysteine ligase CoaBC [Deinococcus metallilatus]TLK21997.1 bifunctional phosphopantothenoylcysteine decarboxylase/phosphopantothenate--cysteine ligase CoaBC [Deinococcus metallilatus]